jgi:uncharacterized repeat protein (TIGR03803 family)
VRIFYLIVFGVALASCSRTGTSLVPTTVANGGASTASAASGGYKLLYAFKGGSADGEYPYAGLTAVNGKLYGNTVEGGAAGAGTVFELSATGKEHVLYSFGGSPDAGYPGASLLAANGVLYGTTEGGGGGTCGSGGVGCGAVFEVSTSGNESVLHRFNGHNGSTPIATPVLMNGKLYGTTQSGGGTPCLTALGCGTVFEVSMSGNARVIYRFTGTPDGANPYDGLVALNGRLYGTTFEGGTAGQGYGTVYQVSASGKEHVIYSFLSNGQDGENPYAGVIAVKGKLYGTTQEGGANGQGTVFELSTSGKERVLHTFTGGADGRTPYGGLTAVNGALYGTTSGGGLYTSACGAVGCGTVFKVTMSGTETVLYSFQGGTDGSTSEAGLIALNGTLYGTTVIGGSANLGTVFKISP